MAIKKSYTAVTGTVSPNAYHKISRIDVSNSDEMSISCDVQVYNSKNERDSGYQPIVTKVIKIADIQDETLLTVSNNLYEALYAFIKTLEGYEGSIDV